MTTNRIIQFAAICLTALPVRAQVLYVPASPSVPVGEPECTTSPTMTMSGPPYLQTAPIIQAPPPVMPVFPGSSTAVPLPSQTPGSIFGPPMAAGPPGVMPQPGSALPAGRALALPPPPGMNPGTPGAAGAMAQPPGTAPAGPLSWIAPGGAISPRMGLPAGPDAAAGSGNPLSVPVADEERAWDQIAEVVSEYFPIASEQRARRTADLPLEGRIETAPQTGATWLEPHRKDSVGFFSRWESTFQTIRRWAVVRVLPDATGYSVDVVVNKEIEDLPQPEKATAGASTFRNDGSLPSRRLEQVSHTRSSPRWIPLGRDTALEQRMLADIHARLSSVTTQPGSLFAR